MRTKKQKKKELSDEQLEIVEAKDFFDRTMPGVIRFYTDHYICGNFYKSCWAVTEYPPSTEETAILAHLADRNGVTLRIYNRLVTSMEQRKIVQQAMRKNHMMTTTNDVNESIKAQNNIDDVVELLSELRRNKEPLLHTAVFIELKASTEDKLKELQRRWAETGFVPIRQKEAIQNEWRQLVDAAFAKLRGNEKERHLERFKGKIQNLAADNANDRRLRTAELAYLHRDHAWIATWGSKNGKTYVVIVMVEHGGGGSSVAGPVAKKVYEYLFGPDTAAPGYRAPEAPQPAGRMLGTVSGPLPGMTNDSNDPPKRRRR